MRGFDNRKRPFPPIMNRNAPPMVRAQQAAGPVNYADVVGGRGLTRSEAQFEGVGPASNYGYRVYCDNSGAITASATVTITTTFANAVEIWEVGGAATSGGTAAIGHRDAFTISMQRSTGDMLTTEALLGTAYYGVLDQTRRLIYPWQLSAGESLLTTYVNQSASSTPTVYIAFHCVEPRG